MASRPRGDKNGLSKEGSHAYVNKGMDTPSVYTIESSQQYGGSRDSIGTAGRRGSFSSAMESSFDGSKLSLPSLPQSSGKPSVAASTAELLDGSGGSSQGEGPKERETWDNKAQYILAVVGYAVGLGNVWRFPYLAQKNGGGAFLIPYTIMLAIEGIPIFYLELVVGQRLRKGAIGAWNQVCPYLGGIGIASCFVSFWVALYYNTIIAWCIYYLVQSFRDPLPWAQCPEVPDSVLGSKVVTECEMSDARSYFWYREALNISPSVEEGGDLNWWILVSLMVSWLIVFLCMVKGIASSGKVVYVTATFPYLVLVIFFFRGVTLEGFYHGLEHFFVPDFKRLGDPQVWLEAATQIFFSLGLAFGGLIAFSSYMPVRNNCYRDALLVSLVNCGTSVFAGIVIFSILGFKATRAYDGCLDTRNSELLRLFNSTSIHPPPPGTIINVTKFDTGLQLWTTIKTSMPEITSCDFKSEIQKSGSGTGLAFIAFTEAVTQFPAAQFWAVLFFLMLLTLGLDSMFGTLEGVITSIVDMNLVTNLRKDFLAALICLVSFMLSFCFANQAGPYIFTLFDEYSGNIPLLVIALAEVIGIAYIYGLKRFGDDIQLMTGQRPNWYWLAMWKYVSPIAMCIILLASVVKMAVSGTSYDAWSAVTADTVKQQWPAWCKFFAAFLILSSLLWIPIVGVLKYFNIVKWKPEQPADFPEDDLIQERNIKPYIPTEWERKLFYWKEKL
ncbi:sodium- and chloride-dependent transporter XTRP3-like [Pecten maximus]|uniref:sodium- and chloride-dependent transporter XTRP3-like n=1 Tax=Pecten maximus TaxID=6579 RepID=UPI001458FE7A|nr:sodium- and chloride-dependent transporter XTRP3-like [Pecten maximus]